MEGAGEQLAAFAHAKTLFDVVRKKSVAATPEEKVRQMVIHYLIEKKQYPRVLLGVEISLSVNRLQKRCDLLAYKNNQPVMIAECKAPSVKISQAVFEQAARYNLSLQVPYLLVTNGLLALCCRVDLKKGTFEFLDEIPAYSELLS